ncbi:hypothetical protein [Massilia sp. HP4]|uniref:hypothetical protein n=1 Tax=Massilia sp. HP4 TaxID=2562316 RepID=UPI0010C0070F|nr:hypothetical protein [Massilia sp. HP4]
MNLAFKPIVDYTESGEISTAFMIESIYITDDVKITGWKAGEIKISLTKTNAQPRVSTHLRPDVSESLKLTSKLEVFGFEISYPVSQSIESVLIFEAGAPSRMRRHELKIPHRKTTNTPQGNLVLPEIETLRNIVSKKKELLIVGSAPTLTHHMELIKKFDGDIWALNDAWMHVEQHGIRIDAAVVTDSRFLKKRRSEINSSPCCDLITIDTVNLDPIREKKINAYVLKSLGRDGFSRELGEVYHGCSVFFTALQTACSYTLNYENIKSCGVLLSPPKSYARIDGSNHMPEYVHATQLKNARRAMEEIRKFRINFEALDAESNLNYL